MNLVKTHVNNPGLYILFGKDESSDTQLAYIGESENFFTRITSHSSKKDFWDEALVFTGDLNKAHVKYLEHRAVQLAKHAGRVRLNNAVTPPLNRLSEYDKVGMELFFQNLKYLLEVFGYDIFKSLEESTQHSKLYYLKGQDFDATARLLDSGEMIVLAGSLASIAETNSFGGWAQAARKKYLDDGTLVETGASYRFTKDITFRKPSAAAATIAARSINGWTAWKSIDDKTLDEIIRR